MQALVFVLIITGIPMAILSKLIMPVVLKALTSTPSETGKTTAHVS